MASIAYVSDNKILEFHRLNGSSIINFFRYSTMGFTDFKQGDLLFFLSRERSKQKERAIVGYGRCKEINKLTINQTWQRYNIKNGFLTYDEFKNYIIKNADKKIKLLGNIILEDVTFFQNEIFLSDFNFDLSNHLVTFTYLDKEADITSKILENGIIDIWSMATSEIKEDTIENTKIVHDLNLILSKIGSLKKINIKKAKDLLNKLVGFNTIKEDRLESYKIVDKKLVIALPLVCNSKNINEKFKNLLGHIISIKYLLKQEGLGVKFKVVSNIELDMEMLNIVKEINDDRL